MYNLIMGDVGGVLDRSRIFEYTDDDIKSYVAPSGIIDTARLGSLPTLAMPEPQDRSAVQVAQVGHVEAMTFAGVDCQFRFVPSPHVQPIATDLIEAAGPALGISRWEFNRTHWAVKRVDLYRVLGDLLTPASRPKVFTLPVDKPRDKLVSVMMPFDAGFSPVYDALKHAATSTGLTCRRADDIWDDDAIIQDVVSLIYRSQVVIADLTGKNANVFYEVGIAHTLGRDAILLTQHPDDVPFDLRHLRYVRYLANSEGLTKLQADVETRLATLLDTAHQ